MGLCMAQLFFCGMKRRKENLRLKKKHYILDHVNVVNNDNIKVGGLERDRVIINSISKSICSPQIISRWALLAIYDNVLLFFLCELCHWFSQLLSNMVKFYCPISMLTSYRTATSKYILH